jgi:hypothetical protein
MVHTRFGFLANRWTIVVILLRALGSAFTVGMSFATTCVSCCRNGVAAGSRIGMRVVQTTAKSQMDRQQNCHDLMDEEWHAKLRL